MRFDKVADWRNPIGPRHTLSTVMAIVALACLAGVGQGYRAVSRSAKRLTKLPRRALRCRVQPDSGRAQVPSEAVFQRVLKAMPRSQIEAIALQWQNDLLGPVPAPDAVVTDGKEVRGGDVVLVNAIAQPSRDASGRTGGQRVKAPLGQGAPQARSHLAGLDRSEPVQPLASHPPHPPSD